MRSGTGAARGAEPAGRPRPEPASPAASPAGFDWHLPAAVGVVLLGAGLRFAGLPAQPGLHFDEAANGFDVLDVLDGRLAIFFTANRGREPLFIYWQSLFVALLGLSPFALRLAAAFVGVAVVAATHFAALQLFVGAEGRPRARRIALGAAFLVATGYWPLLLSRVGLRSISLALFALLTVGFLWRGLRRDRWLDFAAAGLCGGLAMYTYFASRLLPLLAALLAVLAVAQASPSLRRRRLAGLALAAGVWLAVFAPLAAYYVAHPDVAWSRVDEVSIFNPEHWGGEPVRALRTALRENARFIVPELARQPTGVYGGGAGLDAVAAGLAWLGLAAALWRVVRRRDEQDTQDTRDEQDAQAGREARPSISRPVYPGHPVHPVRSLLLSTTSALPYAFLLIWLAVMASPSLLAIHAPHYMRAIGALPALALLGALGASRLASALAARGRPVLGRWLAAGLLLASGLLSGRDYFAVWLPSESTYYQLMAEKVEAAGRIAEWAASGRVFLAPLYYQDYTVRLVAREAWGRVQTFEAGGGAVVLADQPTLYVFPAIDAEQPPRLLAQLGPAARLERVASADGKPLLTVVRVEPAAAAPPAGAGPALATLEGGIELLAAWVEPAALRPGESLRVALTWRAGRRLPESYTVFVHLRDAAGQTVAQRDGPPGGGALSTLGWQPGDVVLDERQLALPPDLAPSEHRVVVGMYRLATLRRLELVVGAARAAGDELAVGSVRVSR